MHFHCQGSLSHQTPLGCSCLVPVLTPANSHGVVLEDCWQRSKLFLLCAPRRERRPRYVGTRYSPLPFTSRAHLAASPLSLPMVNRLGLCHGGRAFGTDQRAFVFDQARTWRTSPHHDACRVLPPQRVGVRLPLLWGGQIGTARLGLNGVFVLQMASASTANPRNNASGCIACFPTIVYRPLRPGVLP